ncbi:MAG: hypothetical protein J6U88_03185 [Bacteroidales bacterium]|nr:hypothetical protein [Bacteroidales bacterium]
MDLIIDKSKVTEGDIIEVSWNCPEADTATLTLDNGTNKSSIAIEKSGVKKFKLNRVGKTTITLSQSKTGKSKSKSHTVKVSAKKYDTYQRVGDNKMKEWFGEVGQKIKNYWGRTKYGWSIMPKDKKQASTSLFIIMAIMIISSFFPSIVFFGLSLLAIYCFYILMKK